MGKLNRSQSCTVNHSVCKTLFTQIFSDKNRYRNKIDLQLLEEDPLSRPTCGRAGPVEARGGVECIFRVDNAGSRRRGTTRALPGGGSGEEEEGALLLAALGSISVANAGRGERRETKRSGQFFVQVCPPTQSMF
jgi:hypothetical protein